jgi:dTDP-4-dehydrorhamnose 3,5-epimerase
MGREVRSLKILEKFFEGNVFTFEYFKSGDTRGDFGKVWEQEEFPDFSIAETFFSRSKKDVIRGFHYIMKPATQKRIVVCLEGRVRDIVVDIRKGSPTYGKFISIDLDSKSNLGVYIGKGFAHGFHSKEESILFYLIDGKYEKEYDKGVLWNDPDIGVGWGVEKPIVSERDLKHPLLKDAENNFVYGEE